MNRDQATVISEKTREAQKIAELGHVIEKIEELARQGQAFLYIYFPFPDTLKELKKRDFTVDLMEDFKDGDVEMVLVQWDEEQMTEHDMEYEEARHSYWNGSPVENVIAFEEDGTKNHQTK